MGDQREKVLAAANKIRREGHVPDEVAPLVAELLEKHRELHIGPSEEGGWPRGWIAVDKAQTNLASALLGEEVSA